jgi:ankyrin repeat protein
MNMHEFLDCNFGEDGEQVLIQRIKDGEDLEATFGELEETPLLVATRRRRLVAIQRLIEHGAQIDATNKFGKTSFAHAVRRRFSEVADFLAEQGANTNVSPADQFAIAVVDGKLDEARAILASHPEVAKTGNPEEDRLLADVAGRNETEPVKLLIDAGADLTATALDSGTPLHQAAWFGQPENAKLLVEAGAPLDHFEPTHNMSPIGWAVHGGKFSGGADERPEVYVELVRLLLDAGSSLEYPTSTGDDYFETLLRLATPPIKQLLTSAR